MNFKLKFNYKFYYNLIIFLLFLYILNEFFSNFQKLYLLNKLGGDMFLSADWLINYNFGFVRRGFPGNLFVNNFLTTSQGLLILSLLQISIYLILIFLIFKILLRKDQNFLSLVMVTSPLFLLNFPINDFRAGFRKEIVGYLAILLLISSENKNKIIYYVQLIYLLSIFSSEMNLLFFPFLLFLIYTNSNLKKAHIFFTSLSTFLYMTLYFFTKGNYKFIEEEICRDLIQRAFSKSICEGSISFIESSTIDYFNVSNSFYSKDYFIYYIVVLFFGSLPLFVQKLEKVEINFHLLNFLYFLPFVLISMDWGRFISIYFSICYLYFLQTKTKKILNLYLLIPLFIFNFFWSVQHCCVGSYYVDSYIWNLIFRFLN